MEDQNDNAMVILNVSVYQWQRRALEKLQQEKQSEIGEFSLSQATRLALSKILAHPESISEVSA